MLEHLDGSMREDLYLINSISGDVVATSVHWTKDLETDYNEEIKRAIKRGTSNCISIHNHPNNIPPTGSDILASSRYRFGMVFCHDGKIYAYKMGNKQFTSKLFDMSIAKYKKLGYDDIKAGEMALNEFKALYGLKWRKWEL